MSEFGFGAPLPISIHAPRTGSDYWKTQRRNWRKNFNPRSPHGERRTRKPTEITRRRFQSTLPARGATSGRKCSSFSKNYFNPRSPHGERPDCGITPCNHFGHFNPRSPHGERRVMRVFAMRFSHFNPRSPHGERPPQNSRKCGSAHFNPRSPHGERRRLAAIRCPCRHFNPRSPHGERPEAGCPRIGLVNFNPRSPHGERLYRALLNGAAN